MLNDRFGRFELEQHLGRGAMGDVYLARDPEAAVRVALKLIHISLADPEMLEAERMGTELQRRLHSKIPAIAAIYEHGEAEGLFFVVMEYVEGLDLAAILTHGALPEQRAIGIAIQLCRILERIGQVAPSLREGGVGVVHGDIKPENIRLQDGDRVRLLDFGLAKSLSQTRKFTRNIFGSLDYVSPERLAESRVDAQSDLWAVGVVLYQMVAGYLPFAGESPDAMLLSLRSSHPRALPLSCSPGLRDILCRCLALDPSRRYPSAEALRTDLQAFLEGRPVTAGARSAETRRTELPGPKPRRAAPLGAGAGAAPPPRPPGPQRRRRGRFGWRWVAAGLLVAAVASHVFAYREGQALRQALATSGDPEISALCDRFDAIRWLDPAGFVSDDVRRELKVRVVRIADRAFESFRRNAPTTAQEWDESLHLLERALRLGADEEVLAKMAFCRGQIEALQATELSLRRDGDARRRWQRAADEFRQAVSLAPEIVESYAALARIYVDEGSGLYDFEKLKWALGELKSRGVAYGDREKRQLAAGYFQQGMSLYTRVERIAGEAEKATLMAQARGQFDQAAQWCGQMAEDDGTYLCRDADAYRRVATQRLRDWGYL